MRWTTRSKNQMLVNRSSFLRRLAELLEEGYTFHDSVIILMPHYVQEYESVLAAAENSLRAGLSVSQVLEVIGFKRNTLLPIAVSEVDGTLILSLKELAKRLEVKEAREKRLRSILIYPMFLFIFMAALLLLFRQYFLPNFQALTQARHAETGLSSYLPLIVGKIPDILLTMLLITSLVAFLSRKVFTRLPPAEKIRKLVRIPVVGVLLKKTKTSELTGELGSLLRSGLPIQDALAVLESQRLDGIIAEVASNLKRHLIHGIPFEQAVSLTEGLEPNLASFVKHGSDTGHLAEELILYSAHTFETLESDVAKWVSLIQPVLFALLAVCIVLAYLAILLPVYGMIETM
ncbi:competence type IV pilus assembly protein ComGB [Sporosarcina sp. Te-1]|uniref:competence type IV pilus assembly protein ComGB n=1 Tax=Sporosarcina sp. Te-1 TaxID=2818390 RepID=UPI001A9FDAE2|nr:competence type IV pilus assembly protein ComGB [Sporosarcina sp. Te-1]QTD41700.1 type II secretion system F family protein [Sporosarcina sp. Te-1]